MFIIQRDILYRVRLEMGLALVKLVGRSLFGLLSACGYDISGIRDKGRVCDCSVCVRRKGLGNGATGT